jgi:hypothetical protein
MRTRDIFAYRAQLQAKLDAVDAVINDMGGTATNRTNRRKPTGKPAATNRSRGKRKLSAAARARLAAIARARWKKANAAGKSAL